MESFQAVKITTPKDDARGKTMSGGPRIIVIERGGSEICRLKTIVTLARGEGRRTPKHKSPF